MSTKEDWKSLICLRRVNCLVVQMAGALLQHSLRNDEWVPTVDRNITILFLQTWSYGHCVSDNNPCQIFYYCVAKVYCLLQNLWLNSFLLRRQFTWVLLLTNVKVQMNAKIAFVVVKSEQLFHIVEQSHLGLSSLVVFFTLPSLDFFCWPLSRSFELLFCFHSAET